MFGRLSAADEGLALEVDGQGLSWRALRERVAGVARALSASGVGRGERVAIFAERGLDASVAMVAAIATGRVLLPLNPAIGVSELRHVLSDARPRVVWGSNALAARVAEAGGALQTVPRGAASDAGARESLALTEVGDAPALLLYTSGTTGAPKGALLSTRNIASNLDALAEIWAWTARDVVVHALPLFHVHGLALGLFGALRRGGALVWVSRFTPDALARALRARPRAVLFAVPTIYHRLVEAHDAGDAEIAPALASARLLVSGSAPLSLREHDRVRALSGREVVERYGLTETLIVCGVRHDRPTPGRVGPPLPGVEVRLVDDRRMPVDAASLDAVGEVAVRGPSVFLGYLGRDEATAAARDADGWFYTGDLATRDASDALRIVGRRSTDLIKTGGFKVGAGEVEEALLEHPAVLEAAVVGAPDPDLGERIVAFVVVRPGPRDGAALADHVARALGPHKRPREVRFVDALPRNAMGKVVKTELKLLA